jgi:hypothetical protein
LIPTFFIKKFCKFSHCDDKITGKKREIFGSFNVNKCKQNWGEMPNFRNHKKDKKRKKKPD